MVRGGDISEILSSEERSSGNFDSKAMRDFVYGCALIDLPLFRGDFTWSRIGVTSKLHMFLISRD